MQKLADDFYTEKRETQQGSSELGSSIPASKGSRTAAPVAAAVAVAAYLASSTGRRRIIIGRPSKPLLAVVIFPP